MGQEQDRDVIAYNKVEQLKKDNPNKSLRELFGNGIGPANYYRGRAKVIGKKTKKTGKVAKLGKTKRQEPLKAAAHLKSASIYQPQSDNMVLLIGSPKQVREALAGRL